MAEQALHFRMLRLGIVRTCLLLAVERALNLLNLSLELLDLETVLLDLCRAFSELFIKIRCREGDLYL